LNFISPYLAPRLSRSCLDEESIRPLFTLDGDPRDSCTSSYEIKRATKRDTVSNEREGTEEWKNRERERERERENYLPSTAGSRAM